MAIFIDTGKIEEIKKYHEMGIIRGVTTNPTILVKDRVTGGMEGVKKRLALAGPWTIWWWCGYSARIVP